MLYITNMYSTLHNYYILEINENATLVCLIFLQQGLGHQTFVFMKQLYFTYSIKNIILCIDRMSIFIVKKYFLKTSYLTPCNVPHE